jgi:hypothetical protein
LSKVERPEDTKPTSHERFYGRISAGDKEGITIKEIKSVSGGPILAGNNVKGGVRFFVIAIQNAWRKEIKTVTANYISPPVNGLTNRNK